MIKAGVTSELFLKFTLLTPLELGKMGGLLEEAELGLVTTLPGDEEGSSALLIFRDTDLRTSGDDNKLERRFGTLSEVDFKEPEKKAKKKVFKKS